MQARRTCTARSLRCACMGACMLALPACARPLLLTLPPPALPLQLYSIPVLSVRDAVWHEADHRCEGVG